MARAVLRILLHGQSGSSQASSTEPCTTEDMSPLLTGGLATTTSTTWTAIPDDDDDMVSLAGCISESEKPSSLLLLGLPPRVGVSLEADNGFPTQ